ncbi:transposase [Legionella sp. 16cNR16C]|nr:transposase [Legionella sp. 16cNR16C]MCE3045204.1 transposase [Legionella sp. 16cNR16C]
MTKRAKYSKEFKLDAISLVLAQGYERKAAAERICFSQSV